MFPPLRLCLLLLLAPLSATSSPPEVTVHVDLSRRSEWTLDPQLFGSYQEEHWGDISPGVYEQYLVNPSFEPWYTAPGGEDNKTRIVFPDVPQTAGVAYPWQPYPAAGATARWSASSDHVNSEVSQCIELQGDEAGILQRVALPDYRVTRYRLRLFLRVEGEVTVRAEWIEGDEAATVLDTQPIPATATWAAHVVELDLGRKTNPRHLDRFGVANLAIVGRGTGRFYVDQATLFPVDAVEGKYNPETLAWIARFKPSTIRWPGGNFTSGYHWRDGVGPLLERPSSPNYAWGGIEPNHVGTDEWLRFCELAGIQPVMGVGFGIMTAQEAAEWVEYCNGDPSTPMGALRAANGHPEPYGVTHWGIGSEVYGSYQIGHTDAVSYANGYVRMARAMRERDPSIKLIAVGLGVHNDYRGQARDWNRQVLSIAARDIDLLDVHTYTYGPSRAAAARGTWPMETIQHALLGSSARLLRYYEALTPLLARPEARHIGIVHYEWGVLPRHSPLGFGRQTLNNALVTAEHYHAFFRCGDLVRGAMLHNFSFYTNPVRAHSEPPNPHTYVSMIYRQFAGSRVVTTRTEGPTYSIPQDIPEIGPLQDIPEVDVIALASDSGQLHICLLNRNPGRDYGVRIQIPGLDSASFRLHRLESDTPDKPATWSTPHTFRIATRQLTMSGDTLELVVPKATLTHLALSPPVSTWACAPCAPAASRAAT